MASLKGKISLKNKELKNFSQEQRICSKEQILCSGEKLFALQEGFSSQESHNYFNCLPCKMAVKSWWGFYTPNQSTQRYTCYTKVRVIEVAMVFPETGRKDHASSAAQIVRPNLYI